MNDSKRWSRRLRSVGGVAGVVGLLAAQLAGADPEAAGRRNPGETLSPGAVEVVQLAEAGLDAGVLLGRIEGASAPFALSAEDILYLQDVGIEAEVITAMIHRDTALQERSGVRTVPEAVAPSSAAGVTSSPAVAPFPPVATNAPAEVVDFYGPLAPYGTWVDLEDMGWCWQPRVVLVDRLWSPYWQGGQWIWSDRGWYWHSYYTWGWAPFHYGRWHRHPHHGWVWFPDTTWGPAWVSWRQTGTHCGWAPLPRGARFEVGRGWRYGDVHVGLDFDFHLGVELFRYVELGHLCDRRPAQHGIPGALVGDIHRQATIRNPEFGGPVVGWHNAGPPVERVGVAWGHPIVRARVEEVTSPAHGAIRPERLVHGGSGRVIERPQLRVPPVPVRPQAQRIDAGHRIAPMPLPRSPHSERPSSPVPAPQGVPRGHPVPTSPGAVPLPRPAPGGGRGERIVVPRAPANPPALESPKGRELRQWHEPRMARPPTPPSPPTSPGGRPSPGPGPGGRRPTGGTEERHR